MNAVTFWFCVVCFGGAAAMMTVGSVFAWATGHPNGWVDRALERIFRRWLT